MRALLAGLTVLFAAGAAAAKDLKVPSDDYPTIQSAATAAQPGDRILVAKGVYQENVTLAQSDVQILGKKAIWDGAVGSTEGDCLLATGNDIVVQGFLFRNGTDQIDATGDRIQVRKCIFRGSGSYAVLITGNGAVVSSSQFYATEAEPVYITGDDALVEKLKMVNVDDGGVYVSGASAVVQKNSITTVEDDYGISVTGDFAKVLKNKVFNAEGGIQVSGSSAVIEGNLSGNLGGVAVDLSGDFATVRGNKSSFHADDTNGMRISSNDALVEGNVLTDIVQTAFSLSGDNMTIRLNTAQRVGTESDDGFTISGANNTIEGNKAIDIDDDGFNISGNGNTLTGNLAVACNGDGFDIASGTGNVLNGCTAKFCQNEGLDNSGSGTDVNGGNFTGNRIDVANDGTFDVFQGVKFSTGGDATLPQLD